MSSTPVNICFALVRWTPVLFITAVIVWSYYAYVIQMCLFSIENIPEKVLYLVIYHPILFIFSWSYWKTIFTDTGAVPKEFYLSRSELEQFENDENEENQKEMLARLSRRLPVQCTTSAGAIRYCEKCKCIKPDRAHHCSVCGRCILKMDHHCPWVNNCVCFTNYKYFVLFLGYGLIYCLWVAGTSLQYFIKFWTGFSGSDHSLANLHVVFLFFASVMFSISLLSLFGYHIFLVFSNRSTLETFRAPIFRSGPDKDGFSLGKRANFIEIFGDSSSKWFFPVYSSFGDGVSYPSRINPTPGSYHSMDNTSLPPQTDETPVTVTEQLQAPASVPDQSSPVQAATESKASFGDGVNYPVRTIDEDYDTLLGQRQRWMEDGVADDEHSPGYDNSSLERT